MDERINRLLCLKFNSNASKKKTSKSLMKINSKIQFQSNTQFSINFALTLKTFDSNYRNRAGSSHSRSISYLLRRKGRSGFEEKFRTGKPGLEEPLRERIEAESSAGGTVGRRRGGFFENLNVPAGFSKGVSARYSGDASPYNHGFGLLLLLGHRCVSLSFNGGHRVKC